MAQNKYPMRWILLIFPVIATYGQSESASENHFISYYALGTGINLTFPNNSPYQHTRPRPMPYLKGVLGLSFGNEQNPSQFFTLLSLAYSPFKTEEYRSSGQYEYRLIRYFPAMYFTTGFLFKYKDFGATMNFFHQFLIGSQTYRFTVYDNDKIIYQRSKEPHDYLNKFYGFQLNFQYRFYKNISAEISLNHIYNGNYTSIETGLSYRF